MGNNQLDLMMKRINQHIQSKIKIFKNMLMKEWKKYQI